MKIRLKRAAKRIFRMIRLLVLLILLFIVAVWAVLQTDYAREKIRKIIVEGVSSSLQQHVELSNIAGHLPFSIYFDRLSISDDEGIWFRVDGFAFEWHVSRLFKGEFVLDCLCAEYVCVERIPEFPESRPSKEQKETRTGGVSAVKLPKWMPALYLNNVGIDCLRLGDWLAGMPSEFCIQVSGAVNRDDIRSRLDVKRTDGLVDNVSFAFALTNKWKAGSIHLSLKEDQGGIISVLAGEEYSPVCMTLSGGGQVTNWFGHLDIHAGPETNRIGCKADYCFVDHEQFRVEWGVNQSIIPGQVRGSLQLDAPLKSPVIEADAFLENLQLSQLVQMPLQPFDVRARAGYMDEHIHAYLCSTGIPQCSVSGTAHIPARLGVNPFVFNIGKESPVDGSLDGTLDLSLVAPLLQTFQQNVKGIIKSRIKLGGMIGAPDVDGYIKMDDALYENLKIGLLLRNIDVDIGLEKDRMEIRTFTADDIGQGSLKLTGEMVFGDELQESLDFHFLMNNAQLVNQTLVSASASADIRIKGDHEQILIGGTSTIERVLVNLQETLPPDVTEIKIVEINKPGQQNAKRKEAKKKEGPEAAKHIELDIAVKSPGRIAVNGRGLTSEWKADMHVGGDASRPKITGGLAVVRGYFVFLGKRLQLDQCSVTFDGSWPVVPSVDVRASTVSGDIIAGIRIYGPVTAPQIHLHSEPSRPEDEILSMMLFGKRPDELSATEALKIAYGLNVLRGGFGANGLLTRTQKSLGIDQIGLSQGDNDQTQLTVGKYIGKYIYIEGEKSLQGDGDAVKVDFNVTRNIQLKTKASSEQGEGSSVYLRWHTDY